MATVDFMLALAYLDAGWHPLPLPAGAKHPPPDGLTGAAGVDLTRDDIELHGWPPGNIGLRMPVDVLGIDADVYRGGAKETMRRLVRKYGQLPTTMVSHNGRNDGSGIRFYRVPNGLRFMSGLPGVDFIQRHHRYAVVWPSIHPDGRSYGWWDEAEERPHDEPRRHDPRDAEHHHPDQHEQARGDDAAPAERGAGGGGDDRARLQPDEEEDGVLEEVGDGLPVDAGGDAGLRRLDDGRHVPDEQTGDDDRQHA